MLLLSSIAFTYVINLIIITLVLVCSRKENINCYEYFISPIEYIVQDFPQKNILQEQF